MRKDIIAQTLKWLSGKKSVIATLLTLVLGYCFANGLRLIVSGANASATVIYE